MLGLVGAFAIPAADEAHVAGAEGEVMKKLVDQWKEANASEAGDRGLKRKEANASDGSSILKKKRLMKDLLAVSRSAETGQEVQPVAEKKKRMKVVKKRLPKEVIDLMKLRSPVPDEIPEQYSRYYAWRSAQADYEKALIDQYNEQGYAEDETEVTDDEI